MGHLRHTTESREFMEHAVYVFTDILIAGDKTQVGIKRRGT